MSTINLEVPDELVEAVAQRAAEIVLQQSPAPAGEGFMNAEQAAEFVGVPIKRIYNLSSLDRIPKKKVGSTLVFD